MKGNATQRIAFRCQEKLKKQLYYYRDNLAPHLTLSAFLVAIIEDFITSTKIYKESTKIEENRNDNA